MSHPLLGFRNRLLFYATAWLAVAGVHFLLLRFEFAATTQIATIDAISANAVFAILGLCFWYPVRYLSPEQLTLPRLAIAHLISAGILNAIWLGFLYLLYDILSPDVPVLAVQLTDTWIWRFTIGLLFYLAMISYYYTHIYYAHFQQKVQQENELKSLITETELKTLKFQINPHFIFNSLNSINALILTEPQMASEMTVSLANFLRTTLAGGDKSIKRLADELQSVRQYLAIEKIRFGSRLKFEEKIDSDCLEAKVPNMLLQPLFENAIKHGVYESTNEVKIRLRIYRKEKFTVIALGNSCEEAVSQKPAGTGIGLTNIRRRLELVYHYQDLVRTHPGANWFEIEVYIPEVGDISE